MPLVRDVIQNHSKRPQNVVKMMKFDLFLHMKIRYISDFVNKYWHLDKSGLREVSKIRQNVPKSDHVFLRIYCL